MEPKRNPVADKSAAPWLLAGAVGLVLGIGAWVGLSGPTPPAPSAAPPGAAAPAALPLVPAIDQPIAEAERERRLLEARRRAAAGVIAAPQDLEAAQIAVRAMGLTSEDAADAERAVAEGRARVVAVECWDFAAADGDRVRLASPAMTTEMTLDNEKSRREILLPPGGAEVVIQGMRDGGGGITVACEIERQPILEAVLQPGEEVRVVVK